jgi:hypothetical protein
MLGFAAMFNRSMCGNVDSDLLAVSSRRAIGITGETARPVAAPADKARTKPPRRREGFQ